MLAIGACYATAAWAQGTSAGAAGVATDGATLESEPLRCWLKSSKTSVHVGEQFNVALTCAVVETTRAVVVPDVSQIEAAAIQLAPFEVLGGRRHPDIKQGIWRYFQYEYTARLVADGFFGQDLAVPPISLNYRVNMLGAGASQEGREKTYVLPQLPIRVVSLVPTIATDIRDSARDTFARIAERNVVANVAFLVAGVLYAFAAVLAVLMLVRAFGAVRQRDTNRDRSMSVAAVADASLKSLRRVGSMRAREGWTPALVTQALALARIAGALALERPVAQPAAAPDAVAEDGQVLAARGVLRRRTALLSASSTPLELATAANRFTWPDRGPLLAEVRAALVVFSEARYARTSAADAADLDAALERVRNGLQRARVLNAWPVRALCGVRRWWRSRGLNWAH
jgi:hypothetical protein